MEVKGGGRTIPLVLVLPAVAFLFLAVMVADLVGESSSSSEGSEEGIIISENKTTVRGAHTPFCTHHAPRLLGGLALLTTLTSRSRSLSSSPSPSSSSSSAALV